MIREYSRKGQCGRLKEMRWDMVKQVIEQFGWEAQDWSYGWRDFIRLFI